MIASPIIQQYLSDRNQLKGIVPSGFLAQNAALIADSGADEAETVVPKLLLNKGDKEKKGRQILCTPEYTQVGIANREFEGENYYVIVFANNDCVEDGEPELPNADLSELKQAFDLYDHDGSQKNQNSRMYRRYEISELP